MSTSSTRRQRRFQRHQAKRPSGLNLVALMDIFTILVFFLLVNSTNVQPPSSPDLRLPEAHIDKPVEPGLTIELTDNDIVVQGRKVAEARPYADPAAADLIPGLVDELRYQASRDRVAADSAAEAPGVREPEEVREVMLMADREVPFLLVKRIMLSAAEAEYDRIAFAVIGKAAESP